MHAVTQPGNSQIAQPNRKTTRKAEKQRAGNNDTGSSIMKKIRRAEFLLAVAIITSAVVMQIREHMLKVPATGNVATLSCGTEEAGLAPASCVNTRSEKSVQGVSRAPHAASNIWV
jgi:hypothetical protein